MLLDLAARSHVDLYNSRIVPSLESLSLTHPPHSHFHFSITQPIDSPSPQGAGFSFTTCFTRFLYASRSFLYKLYASACAGLSGFTSSSSIWMPSRISLIVMAGFQPSSSLRMERQTVPEG